MVTFRIALCIRVLKEKNLNNEQNLAFFILTDKLKLISRFFIFLFLWKMITLQKLLLWIFDSFSFFVSSFFLWFLYMVFFFFFRVPCSLCPLPFILAFFFFCHISHFSAYFLTFSNFVLFTVPLLVLRHIFMSSRFWKCFPFGGFPWFPS